MTVKELSQLYRLNREIEEGQKRLDDLRLKVSSPSGSNLSGVPGGGHSFESRLERLCAEIIDLESIVAHRQQMCIHERNRLERYIQGIPDSLTRQIFTLRFINGLNWVQTADHIGGGNTDVSVRQRVYRYLKSTK